MTDSDYTFAATGRMLTVALDGQKVGMHVHRAGADDRPDLVLLHGGGPGASGWSNFKQNVPALAAHFRLTLVDLPGFGLSHQPEFTEPFFDYSARAVLAVMDDLGIGSTHMLGNSLGGGTAAKVALMAPQRVQRMVLMGPGGISFNTFYPGLSEGLRAVRDFYRDPGPTREKMATFLEFMVHDKRRFITEELLDERFASASDPSRAAGTNHALETVRRREFFQASELWREADRLHHPILLTWGRDDKTMPLDGAFFPLKRLRNARLHVFPNCGHWAQLECQDEFERLTIDFLRAD